MKKPNLNISHNSTIHMLHNQIFRLGYIREGYINPVSVLLKLCKLGLIDSVSLQSDSNSE